MSTGSLSTDWLPTSPEARWLESSIAHYSTLPASEWAALYRPKRGRRADRLKDGLEPIGDRLTGTGEEVAVAVAGDRNGAVPEVLFHLLHVPTVGNEDGSAGVAQIVEPEALWDDVFTVRLQGRLAG